MSFNTFTGREWVFKAISNWLYNPDGKRYFLLAGEPGSGKTAIAKRLWEFSDSKDSLHKELTPGFLNAVHFCSARESTSVDPYIFFSSIASSLAKKVPQYAHALVQASNDLGEKQINIIVDQSVETAQDSTIVGVAIGNLDVSGVMSVQELFNLLILKPLSSIYRDGFNQKITILVDGLDEALTHDGTKKIVDLLSTLRDIPSNIRFILTSRKETKVRNNFEDAEELILSDSKFNQLNQSDVHEYIKKRLTQDEKLSSQVSGLEAKQQEEHIENITNKSEGNFLYVTFLLDEIASGQRSLNELEGLPEGLDGLYYQSLKRVVESGKQDWRKTYASFLGILSVALTSLTLTQLQAFTKQSELVVHDCLIQLQQFLEEVELKAEQAKEEKSYRFYHQSFINFLHRASLIIDGRETENDYYLSVKDSHQLIADYYWEKHQPLNALDWSRLDSYAYHYLANHLFESGRKEELYALLTASPHWMNAKFTACTGDAAYVGDLELALKDFADPLTQNQLLVLAKLYTARQLVNRRVSIYDDSDLKTLVWLGREAEALNHAQLTPRADRKFSALLTIHYALQEQKKVPPKEDQQTLNRTLLDEAEKVAGAIKDNLTQAIELQNLAVTLVQAERDEQASKVFTKAGEVAGTIEDQTDRAEVLSELALALAQARRDEQASEVFTQAREVAGAIEQDPERVWALQKLALALAQARRVEEAIAVFTEAEKVAGTIEQDLNFAKTLQKLAVALVQMGRDKQANEVFTKAREVAGTIENQTDRAEVVTELALALAQARRDKEANEVFTQAREVAGAIEQDPKRVRALQKLALALFQAERNQKANAVFDEAKEVADKIENDTEQAKVRSKLAVALAQAGRTEEAIDVFYDAIEVAGAIKQDWHQVIVLTELAATLVQAKCVDEVDEVFEEAKKVADKIEQDEDLVKARTELALALAQARRDKEASKVFTQTRKVAGAIEKDWYQVKVLTELALALVQTGRGEEANALFTQARKIADAIKKDSTRVWALQKLALALVQAERGEEAIALFAEAREVAGAIEDYWERTKVLTELALALVQARYFTEAEEIAHTIEEGLHQSRALSELAAVLAQAGLAEKASAIFSEAEKIARAIDHLGKQSKALYYLAVALVQADDLTEAGKVAHTIEKKLDRTWALQKLAVALVNAKRNKEARKIFNEAREIADAIEDYWKQAEALSELAAALAQVGRTEKANAVFAEAREVALKIEKKSSRAWALQKLAADLVRAERDEQAMQVLTEAREAAGEIENYSERAEVLSELAAAWAQIKRFQEAFSTLGLKERLSQFLAALVEWVLDCEKVDLGLSVIQEAIRICGWVHSDWDEISTNLRSGS